MNNPRLPRNHKNRLRAWRPPGYPNLRDSLLFSFCCPWQVESRYLLHPLRCHHRRLAKSPTGCRRHQSSCSRVHDRCSCLPKRFGSRALDSFHSPRGGRSSFYDSGAVLSEYLGRLQVCFSIEARAVCLPLACFKPHLHHFDDPYRLARSMC